MPTALEERYKSSHIKIGIRYRFAYPVEFTILDEYSKHRNAIVRVTGSDPDSDPVQDEDGISDIMFKVIAEDGWVGCAWESELEPIQE